MKTLLLLSVLSSSLPFGRGLDRTPLDEDVLNSRTCLTEQLRDDHPVLCHWLDRLDQDEARVAAEIHEWAESRGLLVEVPPEAMGATESLTSEIISGLRGSPSVTTPSASGSAAVVFAHGMGDSCFNSGMIHIAKYTSSLLGGVYSTCIPTGATQAKDTSNGYFLNMDASIDVFAEGVRKDPALAGGFDAIGFSQGNAIIRGYIARYNDPPVRVFMSVNGVNGGVSAVPYCIPKDLVAPADENVGVPKSKLHLTGVCDILMEQASRRAYTEYTQKHLFQSNYWRDVRPSEYGAYTKYCQLARLNNEGDERNQTLVENFGKTERFVWILAEQDTMVFPKEGEQWGSPDPNDPFHSIIPMKETDWYKQDYFGLKTADEAGKNFFESFDGDHLRFEMKDFDRWVRVHLAGEDPPMTIS